MWQKVHSLSKAKTKDVTAQEASSKSAAPPKKKKIALALQGGGSFGAFTWGVIDAFLEDGRFEIEGLSGTSAGGMNAVALAQGLLKGGPQGGRDEMRRLWQKISDMGAVSPYRRPFSPFAYKSDLPHPDIVGFFSSMMQGVLSPYQSNPMDVNILRDMVEEFFDFKLLQTAKDLKVFLCATHVATGKLKLFNLETLTVQKVLASACLPFLFQAVEVDDEYYWDGGFVGNPAIYPLIYDCTAPDIVVIQLTVMNRKTLPISSAEITERHKEITYNACLMREMRMINFVTELIDAGAITDKSVRRVSVHMIRNEELFREMNLANALNPDWSLVSHLHEKGRATGKAWLEENGHKIGSSHAVKKKTELSSPY